MDPLLVCRTHLPVRRAGRTARQQQKAWPWTQRRERRSDGTDPSGGPTSGGPQTGEGRSKRLMICAIPWDRSVKSILESLFLSSSESLTLYNAVLAPWSTPPTRYTIQEGFFICNERLSIFPWPIEGRPSGDRSSRKQASWQSARYVSFVVAHSSQLLKSIARQGTFSKTDTPRRDSCSRAVRPATKDLLIMTRFSLFSRASG